MLTKMLRASVQVIQFRTSATSTASTVAAPSTIQNGDLLVLYDSASASSIPTTVTPANFTSILNNTVGTTRRIICSYKIASNSDASSTITGMNGGITNNKILLVFSTKGIASANVFDVAFEGTDGDPTAQTITSGSQTAPLVVISFVRNLNSNYTMTPTEDGVISNSSQFGLYKIYNSTPANVTVDTNDGGANNLLMSFYITITK